MARYTTRDIEEIIASSDLAENKKAGYARDSQNPDVWQRAGIQSMQSEGIQSSNSTGTGQTSSAHSSDTETQTQVPKLKSVQSQAQIPGLRNIRTVSMPDVETLLSDGYKMSKDEKEYAKNLADDYFEEYQRKVRDGEYTTEELVAITNGEDEEFNQMQRLQNKTNGMASFAMGLLDVAKPALTGLGKILGDDQYDQRLDTFQQMESDARTQSPVAYSAGDLAMNMAEYSAAQGILSEIPALNNVRTSAIGKIADAFGGGQKATKVAEGAVNVLGDTGLDIALDVLPSALTDRDAGLSGQEVRNNALLNIGMSLGGNVLGEAAAPLLGRVLSRFPGRKNQIPQLGDEISDTAADVARSADNTAESASKVAADTVPDKASQQTADYIDMSIVDDMDALDFADAPKKITSMPKTTVPTGSRFSTLDKEVSKLVRMYGDDSILNDLEDFRTNIVEFENTGSMQAADNASRALQRMDESLQGRTYTDGGTRTKSGAQKRAGTTYTYGREYAGISDLVDDARQQFDDVIESAGDFERIPQLEDIDDVSERISNPISALERESDRLVYRPQDNSSETSEDLWNQLSAGSEQFFRGTDPDIDYLGRAQRRAANNGEYVTRTATNTLTNSDVIKNNPQMQAILQDEIESGRMNFRTVTEDESIRAAKDALSRDFAGETDRLMSSNWKTAQDFDGGMMLLKSAADAGNHDAVREIARKIASEGHDAGVRLQALEKYSRTAEGAIAKAQNILDAEIKDWAAASPKEAREAKRVADEILGRLDEMLSSRTVVNGDEIQKAVNDIISQSRISGKVDAEDAAEIARLIQSGYADQVESMVNSILATQQYGISDETIDQVISIFDEANKFPENSRRRVNLEEKAYALLANEVTTSNWRDKWDTWRYLSMLSKPATHERNLIGNVGMNVVSGVKNNLAATMEAALDRIAPNGIQRSRSVLNPLSGADRGLISAAADDAENVAYRALSGSKYNVTGGIRGQAKAFRNGAGRAIQWLADKNSGLLEAEDWLGLKAKYSTSLAGYLKANGLDSSALKSTDEAVQNIVNQGREFAINEAQRATFHEESTLANALSQLSRNMSESNKKVDNAIGMLIEGIVPFKKTPINIVKTAGRYSPLNIANAVVKGVQAVKSGRYTASEVLDSLASGLTGSGIMALGAYLGSQGLIRGSGTGDEDQDAFDELRGAQNYSLVTDDGSYTIDWAAPSVLPLLVGVELQQSLSDGGIDSSDLINAITSLADPIIETTMMSGISDALSAVQYAEDDADVLSTFAANALTGYATQGIPSSLGAVTRAIDNTRRTSYSDSTGAAGELEYTLNSTRNKIPGLSDDAPEYRDAWGRTQENFQGGGGLLGNLAYQFFSPGYYSEDRTTPADTYLQGLYDATGNADVLPTNISRSYGNGKKMTGEEYSEAQRISGQTSHQMIEYLRTNQGDLSRSSQADIVDKIYGLSNAIALQDVVGKEMSDSNARLNEIYQSDGVSGLVNYLIMDSNIESNTDGKQANVIAYLQDNNVSPEQGGEYLVTSGAVNLDGSDGRTNNGLAYDQYGAAGLYNYVQMNNYDANGDGRKTKEDVISFLERSDLTPEQKAYFFYLRYPKSNNPYS